MIDIPLGKALVPVLISETFCVCKECAVNELYENCCEDGRMACHAHERKDGKDVIYLLLNFPT